MLKRCIKSVDVTSVDLSRTVIICSTRNEVDNISNECLKLIDGREHIFEATDTDSNGQPLREADKKRMQHINTCLPDTITLKEGTMTKSKYFTGMGQWNIVWSA